MREEHKLRVFDNRVIRRIFGFENEKVIGNWRRLQKEELYDLYFTLIIIQVITQRKMRWPGHVACIAARRVAYRVW
jgi:hypothetical protein